MKLNLEMPCMVNFLHLAVFPGEKELAMRLVMLFFRLLSLSHGRSMPNMSGGTGLHMTWSGQLCPDILGTVPLVDAVESTSAFLWALHSKGEGGDNGCDPPLGSEL